MKRYLAFVTLFLFCSGSAWGFDEQEKLFRQSIPQIAVEFIGIPYKYGGNPQQSGTTDNSHLFFSIYSLAAQKAGLFYKEYLTMKNLLKIIEEIDENDLKNGDLMVLNDGHTAMAYYVENTQKIHFLYSSEKRQQVLSFTSDHIVFHAYWLENLKGFYRLPDMMFTPVE
jgi:hypothetical protein